MTLSTHRKAFGQWQPALLAIALAGVVAGMTARQELLSSYNANMRGVAVTKQFITKPGDELRGRAIIAQAERCSDYPSAVATLLYDGLAPSTKLDMLEAWVPCWVSARPSLGAGWRAGILWKLGRHEEVCRLLTKLGSATTALSYAQRSIEAEDWSGGGAYLHCTGEIAKMGVWVSPWIVALQYQRLGRHFDDLGAVDAAITAYGEASTWHPGVWAIPYVRKAQLLAGLGRTAEAMDWLAGGIPRSTEATSTFYLWRELGELMAVQGSTEDAVCAYQRAIEVMDQVPNENLPEAARQLTEETMRSLAAKAATPGKTCFAGYPELQKR